MNIKAEHGRILLIIWLPVLIIPLAYSFQSLDPVLHLRFILLSVFLALLGLYLLYKGAKKESSRSYETDPVFLLYLAYILYSLVSLRGTGTSGDALFDFMKIFLLGVFIYFQVRLHPDKNPFTTISRAVVVMGSIILAIGIYQLILAGRDGGLSHEQLYRMRSVFAHKNIFTEILFLCLPFTIYSFLVTKGDKRVYHLAIGAFCIFLIIVSMTRAVWAALILSGILSGLILVVKWRRSGTRFRDLNRVNTTAIITVIILAIAGGIIFYSKADSFRTFSRQADKMINFNYGSSKDRIELWKRSWWMFKEKPLTGHGLAAWKIEVLKYGKKNLGKEDDITFYQRPHNDYVWIATEQGACGLFLYGLFWLLVYIYLIFNLIRAKDPDMFYRNLLVFFGLTGFLIISAFSFPRERIEHIVLAGFLISSVIIDRRTINYKFFGRGPFTSGKKILNLVTGVIISVLVFSVITGVLRFQSEKQTRRALEALDNQQWEDLAGYIDRAESRFYEMDPFSTPLSWYRGTALFMMGETDRAMTEFEAAHRMNPWHVPIMNDLGSCSQLSGKTEAAIGWYGKALEISPGYQESLFNMAAVYYSLGQNREAFEYLARIDSTANREKYYQFVDRISEQAMQSILSEAEEEQLKAVLEKIRANVVWNRDMFRKAVENGIGYREQLLLDAIYVNESIDSVITADAADSLRIKYDLLR